jgi:hypothetical protein
VLVTTVTAGIVGLTAGPVHGVQPLVAGLLLAIAAGILSLALARVVAFGAGGVAAWLGAQALAPGWDQPLICFLVGGLIGLLLFRLWTMVLTSAAGSLLMLYSGLCLANNFGQLDAVDLAQKQSVLLNCIWAGMVFVGVVAQFFVSRRKRKPEESRRRQRGNGYSSHYRERERERSSWWSWGQRDYREAG